MPVAYQVWPAGAVSQPKMAPVWVSPDRRRRLHGCYSAWGPDADRRARQLMTQSLKGSHSGAYSHLTAQRAS